VLESFEAAPPDSDFERRLKIPSDWGGWLGTSYRGRVAYERRFGLPTGLQTQQSIWLVIAAVDFRASISLNGELIGQLQLGSPEFRSEVRDLLRTNNFLDIVVELPVDADRGARSPLAGGLIGEVRLEIEES
jgi:beta-galactosidase/beta-glucuronidase